MYKFLFLVFIISIQLLNAANGASLLHLKTVDSQLNLVELYSSEGCSSCPPADKWLSQLRQEKNLWKSFVPVEFHVDYWDQLGWKDPYAKSEYTQRQKDYAELWKNQNIYTPGIVLNGNEWTEWRKDKALSNLEKKGTNKGSLEVSQISKRVFVVKFNPSSKISDEFILHAALLGNGLSSNVRRGENSGENLHHDFVVLSLFNKSLKKDGSNYLSEVEIIKEKIVVQPKSYSVAFWITDHTKLPIQAIGGDLSD